MTIKSTIQILVWGILSIFASITGAETNWELQAVYSNEDYQADLTHKPGYARYWKVGASYQNTSNKVEVIGIVLNNSEDILNPQANFNTIQYNVGGQWQIFIQGLADDHAGTAAWMGQNYGNLPVGTLSYSNEQWLSEMARINYNGNHQIRTGDLVKITGFALDRNGKSNINERHSISNTFNLNIEWLGQTPGLPDPELIGLSYIKDAVNIDIFDATRQTGGEYYQSRLVRINNVHIVSGDFAPDAIITIGDETGRTLKVKLGLSSTFNTNNLNSTFDIIGVFDQEDGYTTGYRIWVTGYNGGKKVLGIEPPVREDANGDRMVDVGDLGILAANYNRNLKAEGINSQLWRSFGDFNGDGIVDVGDLGILAANYGVVSNFSADYAKAFGTTAESDEASEETIGSMICSGLGLPLIVMLGMMGLMKLKE